jgi:signal transduction histidine kinase/CheY-like chemotaxis protein
MDTQLDGMWLLNGRINPDGTFAPAQRDDIYRYTALTERERQAMETQEPIATLTRDAWGSFITGYVPVYTTEGNFVGLLGIDIDLDHYQSSAQTMIALLIGLFFIVAFTMTVLLLFVYLKYAKLKAEQFQFDFYSRMSHDMRTPMNGILGMAALSEQETDATVLRRNFKAVAESGTYMLELVNDMLDYQQIETGKLTLSPQAGTLNEVISGVQAMIRPAAEQKKINFQVINRGVALDAPVLLDVIHVKRILINLASNAVKFTPERGSVTLLLESARSSDTFQSVRFVMMDTGAGISPDFMKDKLFLPFEQETGGTTPRNVGTGLGLALTKRLTELMGGQIKAESVLGKGSTFTVTLDFQRTAAPAEPHKVTAAAQASDRTAVLPGRHILLCEDHPINAEITRRMVEYAGCFIDVEENGKLGLDRFADSPAGYYDAILMDIRMPVMDGLEAARAIRKLPRPDAQTVPILALTANTYAEDVRNTMAAGMNAHLSKPVDSDVLLQALSDAIAARE